MSKLMAILFYGFLLTACSAGPVDAPPTTSLPPEGRSTLSAVITPTLSPTAKASTLLPDTTIMLSQDGGIAGIHQEWTMSTDGWLDLPSGERIEISPDAVWDLWYSIEDSGMLRIEQGEPKAICCDFFSYTLAIRQGDLNHSLSYSEGDEETPSGFWDVVNSFKKIVASFEQTAS